MNTLEEKYINPLTDFGFKKLFGSEPNKILLIDFLNQILPDRKIKDLSYTSTEKLGLAKVNRNEILDLYCIGDKGGKFIVELQKAEQNYFKERSVFYTSFPIQEQIKKNNWDYKLDAIYPIGILNFIFNDHKGEKEFLHIVELKNQKHKAFYNKLKFVYLELPKFRKKEEELETRFDKWMYIFTHLTQLQDPPKKLQDKIFSKLFETAEIAKFTPKERKTYEESLKHYRDIKNVVDTAREEGFKEGMKIKRKIEIAREMKRENEPIDKIVKYTNLTKEEIEKL
ncbi:MAG: Rpn family recombination-promoting nuclease/putative transposase [Polaribacter sp.]